MRRYAGLVSLLVIVAMLAVAPPLAAEECSRFRAHSSLSGNVAGPGFEGPITMIIGGGGAMDGFVEGSFLSDVDSTGTYTFDNGTFTDIVVNVITPTPDPFNARFEAFGEFIGGTGAYEGATGFIDTRGSVVVDAEGNFTTSGTHTGVICVGDGDGDLS